jgi:hypothetical protein
MGFGRCALKQRLHARCSTARESRAMGHKDGCATGQALAVKDRIDRLSQNPDKNGH